MGSHYPVPGWAGVEDTVSEATKGKSGGGERGAAEGADVHVALSTQDLISLDTSPAKERLEESCVHPLEEAMLGCDVDGEGSGYWADGQEGPPLLPTRARVGQVVSVSNRFSPLVCLWSPLTYLSLVCLWAPAGLTPGHPWPCGSLPAPSGGQVGDVFFCQPWRTLPYPTLAALPG